MTWTVILLTLGICLLAILVMVLAMMKAAGDADRRAEEMLAKWRKGGSKK
jgi:hypothetical protein